MLIPPPLDRYMLKESTENHAGQDEQFNVSELTMTRRNLHAIVDAVWELYTSWTISWQRSDDAAILNVSF